MNVALKVALSGEFGPVGLAIGTAAGAWINFVLLILIGRWRSLAEPDDRLYESLALILFAAAGAALATPALLAAAEWISRGAPFLRSEFVIAATFGAMCLVYGALLALATLMFGRTVRAQLFSP